MITLILITTTILLAYATKASARSPVAMTEKGARVLIWLDAHPKPGTPASRRYVRRRAHRMIWRGLNRAGVVNNFYCIHRWEQPSWWAVAGDYTGGLSLSSGYIRQFAPDFLRAWGWANNWPINIQIVAGYRAVWQGYGYSPWTSRGRCGL